MPSLSEIQEDIIKAEITNSDEPDTRLNDEAEASQVEILKQETSRYEDQEFDEELKINDETHTKGNYKRSVCSRPTLLEFSPQLVAPLREAADAAQLANKLHMQRLMLAQGEVDDALSTARLNTTHCLGETRHWVINMAEQASFIHDTLLRELEAALTVASAVSNSEADALLWDDVRRQAKSASVAHYSLRDEAVSWCADAIQSENGEEGETKEGVLMFQRHIEDLTKKCQGVMEEAIHSITVGERVIYLHTLAAERIMRSLAFAWKLCNWAQGMMRWGFGKWWCSYVKPNTKDKLKEISGMFMDKFVQKSKQIATRNSLHRWQVKMREGALGDKITGNKGEYDHAQMMLTIVSSKMAAVRQIVTTFNHLRFVDDGRAEMIPLMVGEWVRKTKQAQIDLAKNSIEAHIEKQHSMSKEQGLAIMKHVIGAAMHRTIYQVLAVWCGYASVGKLYMHFEMESKVDAATNLSRVRMRVLRNWTTNEFRYLLEVWKINLTIDMQPEWHKKNTVNKMLLRTERWRKLFVRWQVAIERKAAIALSMSVVNWERKVVDARKLEVENLVVSQIGLLQARFHAAEALALSTGDEALQGWKMLWEDERNELKSELDRVGEMYRDAMGEMGHVMISTRETVQVEKKKVEAAKVEATSINNKLENEKREINTALYMSGQARMNGGAKALRLSLNRWDANNKKRCLWCMKINYERESCDVGAMLCYKQLMREWAKQLISSVRRVRDSKVRRVVHNWRLHKYKMLLAEMRLVNTQLRDANAHLMRTISDE